MNINQQRQLGQELSSELQKHFMSWDNNLRRWYQYAIGALQFSSIKQLEVAGAHYKSLFSTEPQGVNLNTVMILINNLECITPEQLGITTNEFIGVIELNNEAAKRWEDQVSPIREKVIKRLQLMGSGNNTPIIAKA